MPLASTAGTTGPLLLAAAALLGVILAVLAEAAIARLLPRVGRDAAVPDGALPARAWTAAATGTLSALLALRLGVSWELPAYLLLAVLGVQLSRIDILHHLLPNPLVLALFLAGAGLLAASASAGPSWDALLRAVAGAGVLFIVYFVLALISPAGLGMGDVKLAAPLGLYLGYLGWDHLFYGGALGFVAGGLVTAVLLRLRKSRKPSEVAFGPSMLGAGLAAIILLP